MGSGSVVEVDVVAIDELEIVGNVQLFANVLKMRFQAVASGQADTELVWDHPMKMSDVKC